MPSPRSGFYELAATEIGFRLTWVGKSMRITVGQEGSSGPLEDLYAHADKAFQEAREMATAERYQNPVVD